jgi:IMP dehydrogenase
MASFEGVELTAEELVNGFAAKEIFSSNDCLGITFDDLIVLPGAIDFAVHEVDLSSQVTRNFKLNYPLCSTPMDTVTEHEMALGMALNGGIGFIHCNCSIEDQVAMIEKVKNYENGFILEPAVLSPDHSITDLDALRDRKKISGVPLTVDGRMGSKLVGLVSNCDTDFIEDRSKRLAEVMTPLEDLVVGMYPITIDEANRILKESKKGYLPIVDADGNLRALTTRTDMKKNKAFPSASRDSSGKLLVGASVDASGNDDDALDRVAALVSAGCNIIVLDAQNGDNAYQVSLLKSIKATYPSVDVVAGNVVRASQAKVLLEAGADALRIGMGVGSVATTQLVKAVGRAQLSSIYACALVARQYGVPVIADGGIKNTGCLIKALAIGAQCVMMGSLLAGVDESPGEYFFQDGKRLKHYRGTFSRGVIVQSGPSKASMSGKSLSSKSLGNSPPSPQRSPTRINSLRGGAIGPWTVDDHSTPYRLASGVSGAVIDKGPLSKYFPYLCQSVRHGLQDMGTRSLEVMWEELYNGKLRFEVRSPSAQREGGVHDLHSFQQRLYA